MWWPRVASGSRKLWDAVCATLSELRLEARSIVPAAFLAVVTEESRVGIGCFEPLRVDFALVFAKPLTADRQFCVS